MCEKNINDKWIKICPNCGKIQCYSNKDALTVSIKNNSLCRNCSSRKNGIIYHKRYIEKYKDGYKRNCPECGKVINYSSSKNLNRAVRENRLCFKCAHKKLRLTNEEKENSKTRRKEYRKEYRQKKDVKEKRKKYMEKYNKDPRIIEKNRKRYKIYIQNPINKISHNIRNRIGNSLKSVNLSKNGRHWEDLVGFTIQDLKEHLKYRFLPGMNWGNYGEWVIDHIIPIKFFKFDSVKNIEFKYCWSLNNLQPLWKKDNIEKDDKIILWGKEINARYMERDYFSKIDSFHIDSSFSSLQILC